MLGSRWADHRHNACLARYISGPGAKARVHRCYCGCGCRVVLSEGLAEAIKIQACVEGAGILGCYVRVPCFLKLPD